MVSKKIYVLNCCAHFRNQLVWQKIGAVSEKKLLAVFCQNHWSEFSRRLLLYFRPTSQVSFHMYQYLSACLGFKFWLNTYCNGCIFFNGYCHQVFSPFIIIRKNSITFTHILQLWNCFTKWLRIMGFFHVWKLP